MKLFYVIAYLVLAGSLAISVLPANATVGETWIYFAYWQNGSWHSISAVSEMNSSSATGYNQQRKCFIDQQGYYWVSGYEYTTRWYSTNPHTIELFSSSNGITWSDRQRLASLTPQESTGWTVRESIHQGIDLAFQEETDTNPTYNKAIAYLSTDDYARWIRIGCTDGTMTREEYDTWFVQANYMAVAPRYANQSSDWVSVDNCFQPRLSLDRGFGLRDTAKGWSGSNYFGAAQDGFSLNGGETVTLTWNETVSYYVTALGNNSVCYGWAKDTTVQNPSFPMNFSTRAGIDALVGCSEPENNGFSQGLLHILYVKNSPQDLYHRTFAPTTDTWSSEEVVTSGTNITSPVLSVDSNGHLLACYIRDNQIRYKYHGSSWSSESTLSAVAGGYANWQNPRWLSTSQLEYNGKILMTWTGDYLNPLPSTQTNSNRWLGIAAPHVYAAITIWSIAMIVGIGLVFVRGQNDLSALPIVILLGIGILICLFISLAVMSGFLRL